MEIGENPVVVGRGAHCGLVIDDPSVSSTHAQVERRNGVVYVKDLNSTNGVIVDGKPVAGEAVIPPGGSVQFGTVSYILNGTELVESGAAAGRTQIIGGARRSAPAAAQPAAASQNPTPPPPPSQGGATSVDVQGISTWLRGLLAGAVGLVGVMTLSVILMFVYFEQYMSTWDPEREQSAVNKWDTWETIYSVVYIIYILLAIPIFVLLVIWAYRSHKGSELLQPGQRKWGRGWAIGAWFIPFANYVLLILILSEIHKIVSAPRSGGRTSNDWPREPVSPGLMLWFIFYGVGGIVFAIGNAVLGDGFYDADGYRGGLIFTLIGLGLSGAAALLGSNFVKDVSSKLSDS